MKYNGAIIPIIEPYCCIVIVVYGSVFAISEIELSRGDDKDDTTTVFFFLHCFLSIVRNRTSTGTVQYQVSKTQTFAATRTEFVRQSKYEFF